MCNFIYIDVLYTRLKNFDNCQNHVTKIIQINSINFSVTFFLFNRTSQIYNIYDIY